MAKQKFNIGDKVRINKRVPKHMRPEVSQRTHLIKDVAYSSKHETTYYMLAGKGHGFVDYYFRGYMLTPVKQSELKKVGRPRTKRKYTKRERGT